MMLGRILHVMGMVGCLSACFMDKDEMQRASSPDGKATAILVRELGGGAAGSSNYNLYFTQAEGKESFGSPNFTASGCDLISIEWKNDLELRVHYSKCSIRQFNNHWAHPDAVSRTRARYVEIVLVRDMN